MFPSGGSAVPRLCVFVAVMDLSAEAGVASPVTWSEAEQFDAGSSAQGAEVLLSPSELTRAPQGPG